MGPKTKKDMRQMSKILRIAALFAMGVMAVGCNGLKDEPVVAPEGPDGGKTVTVTATVGLDTPTKALTAAGVKTFAAGETIAVFYTNESLALVEATYTFTDGDLIDGGRRARITVAMTEAKAGGAVKYIYPAAMANDDGSVKYSALGAQDGTLAGLAANLDLATFDGTLTGEAALPASATLLNPLAIGEFTLKNWSGAGITADITNLVIAIDGVDTYTVARAAADGPVYVAMQPVADTETLTFTATGGSTTYTRTITGKTLESNNMYPVNLKMNRRINLDTVTTTDGNSVKYLAAQDGDIITNGNDEYYITIPDGATVTLDGVSFTAPDECDHAAIHCLGSAHIILNGNNDIYAGHQSNYPAILAAHNTDGEEYTLTISGTGSLSADSIHSNYSAGIGGGYRIPCGNIAIEGGTIEATGGEYAAGIGSGNQSSCGNITISGGQVRATGGEYAAGIGSGRQGSCSDITISGGSIGIYNSAFDTWDEGAIGGQNAAGIGCGSYGSCGKITITDGIDFLYAEKGSEACIIGKGSGSSTCGTVTISGVGMEYDQLRNGVHDGKIGNLYSNSNGYYWILSKTEL